MNNNLKEELHQLIDSINDEQTLHVLKDDIVAYTSLHNVDGLTPTQLKELDEAIKQADSRTGLTEWKALKESIAKKWKER